MILRVFSGLKDSIILWFYASLSRLEKDFEMQHHMCGTPGAIRQAPFSKPVPNPSFEKGKIIFSWR